MAVGAYDGMRVIYEAAKTTKGAGGEALLNAMKGQVFESPRGPIYIDAQTRDIVQNVYIRRVERIGTQMWNREIETVTDVKDIGKTR
jgi:branched-chain amino acid transport system substrate-binding protein